MTTHFIPFGPITSCGLDKRTGGVIVSSPHKLAVTCSECQGTEEFKRAVQRIPLVQGGPYRG